MKILNDDTLGRQLRRGFCILLIIAFCVISTGMVIDNHKQEIPTPGITTLKSDENTTNGDSKESKVVYSPFIKSEVSVFKSEVESDKISIELEDDTNDNEDKLPVITTGKVSISSLEVRSNPRGAKVNNIIGKLNKNDDVNIVDKTSNNWYKIEFKNGYGYVFNKCVFVDEPEENEEPETLKVDSSNDEDLYEEQNPSSEVLGDGVIEYDALYYTLEVIAPDLISICDALIENYERYGIKPSFQLAVFCLESGYGKSSLATYKNNICGLNAYSTSTKSVYENASAFDTKSDCTLKFGEIIYNNYIASGRTTIESIAYKYCPPNAYNWTYLVRSLQSRIENTYNSYAV